MLNFNPRKRSTISRKKFHSHNNNWTPTRPIPTMDFHRYMNPKSKRINSLVVGRNWIPNWARNFTTKALHPPAPSNRITIPSTNSMRSKTAKPTNTWIYNMMQTVCMVGKILRLRFRKLRLTCSKKITCTSNLVLTSLIHSKLETRTFRMIRNSRKNCQPRHFTLQSLYLRQRSYARENRLKMRTSTGNLRRSRDQSL